MSNLFTEADLTISIYGSSYLLLTSFIIELYVVLQISKFFYSQKSSYQHRTNLFPIVSS